MSNTGESVQKRQQCPIASPKEAKLFKKRVQKSQDCAKKSP